MLLRSSSTPVLGSLLSSESPNRDFDKKISISHAGYSSFSSFSCSSSPITPSIGSAGYSEFDKDSRKSGLGGFRRAQSEGNLKGLISDMDEFGSSSKPLTRSMRKPHHTMLQSIPSFSVYNSSNEYDEEEQEEEVEEEEEEVVVEEGLKRSITIGDSIDGVGIGGFCFEEHMELIKEEESGGGSEMLSFSGYDEDGQPRSPPMYLAMGLGMDMGFGGGGGEFRLPEFGEGQGEKSDVEEYYKKMVEENPGNSLFLRNYANYLYQSKGDLRGAEEYYSRAILSDPGEGDTLSQYAKIVWELHHDHERASSYFERAVEVAPHDSHVHAAYASFLWETEDEEEETFQGIGGISVFESRVMTSAVA